MKSVKYSLWATLKKNEAKLDDAFRHAPIVILVFSVKGTNAFQGYARMRSFIGRPQDRGIDPFGGFGRLFDVEWLRLHDLSYREVSHIRNPLNMDGGVSQSRDGQELSNQCGRSLCGLIDRHIDAPESFAAARPRSRSRGRQGSMHPESFYVSSSPMPGYPGGYHVYGQGMPPGQAMTAGPKPRASSSESESERRKKKKKRRKHAPHPLTAGFDEQVEYFLGLDYEEYVSWWRRHSMRSPGPTPPPGMAHLAPPPSVALGAPHSSWAPPGMAPAMGMPPLHAMTPFH